MFLSFTIKTESMRQPMKIGLDVDALPQLVTPLTPLTVLSGANGSGKSNFLQGILTMKRGLVSGFTPGEDGSFLWRCTYLLPGTSLILAYEMEWESATARRKECFRLYAADPQDVSELIPGHLPKKPDRLAFAEEHFTGLSLFDDLPSSELTLNDPPAAAKAAVACLRRDLLNCRAEQAGDERRQWEELPTSKLRRLAELTDGPYPDLSGMQSLSASVHATADPEERLREITAKESPTVYEKLAAAALRNPDNEEFRCRVDALSAAERRLLLLTLPLTEKANVGIRLTLCENPDEHLFYENSEALALLLREAAVYRPGTQWILSSPFNAFLDFFHPREVWFFKAAVSADPEHFLEYRSPQNLGRNPLVLAMSEEGVPLSELAYGAYF